MNKISKKDLLSITGISYGQLYRWKRESLIPEEWFLKQPSFTGQETFFPKDQILSRIESILDLKDQYSLEELSKLFSQKPSSFSINSKHLDIISEIDIDLLKTLKNHTLDEKYNLKHIIFAIALSDIKKIMNHSVEESNKIFKLGMYILSENDNTNIFITIFMINNEFHLAFNYTPSKIHFDNNIKIIHTIDLNSVYDNFNIKYKDKLK